MRGRLRAALLAGSVVVVTACGRAPRTEAPQTRTPATSPGEAATRPNPTRTASTLTPAPTVPRTSAPAGLEGVRGTCRYVFPVRPASAAHYGRYHHDYPASDIFAPRGTDVVAPTDGFVDFVSRKDTWDPATNDGATRGGLSVAIVGDDGVRYYGSHLLDVASAVAVGTRVSAGQLIGHVDSSGDARGIDPHLHFGISHPTAPDDWRVRRGEVSPYDYLNAWKAGRALTPVVKGSRTPRCRAAR